MCIGHVVPDHLHLVIQQFVLSLDYYCLADHCIAQLALSYLVCACTTVHLLKKQITRLLALFRQTCIDYIRSSRLGNFIQN